MRVGASTTSAPSFLFACHFSAGYQSVLAETSGMIRRKSPCEARLSVSLCLPLSKLKSRSASARTHIHRWLFTGHFEAFRGFEVHMQRWHTTVDALEKAADFTDGKNIRKWPKRVRLTAGASASVWAETRTKLGGVMDQGRECHRHSDRQRDVGACGSADLCFTDGWSHLGSGLEQLCRCRGKLYLWINTLSLRGLSRV